MKKSELKEKEDSFQYWLFEMDDALEAFVASIAETEIREKLDFSKESLVVLGEWLIAHQSEFAEIEEYTIFDGFVQRTAKLDKHVLDGFVRYAGETFRKNLGGKWMIDYSTPKNIYYGLPQLKGMKNQHVQFSPYPAASAIITRKDAELLKKILEAHEKGGPALKKPIRKK